MGAMGFTFTNNSNAIRFAIINPPKFNRMAMSFLINKTFINKIKGAL
jgi:phage terminase large subunit-like protein